MVKKFKYSYQERDYRAQRALLWLLYEGTEIQDCVVGLYGIYSLHGVGRDEDVEILVQMMERFAADFIDWIRNDDDSFISQEALRETRRVLARHRKGEPLNNRQAEMLLAN